MLSEILLLNQYYTSKKDAPEYVTAPLPLNLLYLGSYLKHKGMDCRIQELGIFNYKDVIDEPGGKLRCGLPDEKIIEIIKKENPKIVGIGCVYTMHFWDVIALSRLVKGVDPKIKVVLGGNHATIYADAIMKEKSVDFVVRGEGEITFHELCAAILGGKGVTDIKGVSYRAENGAPVRAEDRPLIKNLEELPLPDYSLLDVKKYANPMNKSPYVMRYPLVGIMTSRGCPGKCVFCTVKAVWGRSWRARSAEKTVDEIEALVKNYGIREISFLDDSVSVNKQRWHGICAEIIRRKLDVKWTTPNGIAYWTLDDETLDLMKKAGCYRITFGIESANEETKKFIGKPYPLSHAKELIRHANKIGLWTICTNILGFPYETKEAMQDTVNFAKTSGTDFAAFYLLAPHLTSDVYGYFRDEGLLDYDMVFSDNWMDDEKYEKMFRSLYVGGFPTKYMTAEELKKVQLKAYREFMLHRAVSYLLNPLKLIRKMYSLESFFYVLKLIGAGFAIVTRSMLSAGKFSKQSIFSVFYKRPKAGK